MLTYTDTDIANMILHVSPMTPYATEINILTTALFKSLAMSRLGQ